MIGKDMVAIFLPTLGLGGLIRKEMAAASSGA
jgi:hypothetical protein